MCVYIDDAFLAGTFDNALVQVRVEDFWENCKYVEAHMGELYIKTGVESSFIGKGVVG